MSQKLISGVRCDKISVWKKSRNNRWAMCSEKHAFLSGTEIMKKAEKWTNRKGNIFKTLESRIKTENKRYDRTNLKRFGELNK